MSHNVSVWSQLRGHSDQVAMLRRCLERERLPHGFLFLGSPGIGKRQFARLLAQCLFCQRYAEVELEACGECTSCRQMQAGTHPDYFEINLLPGKRELLVSQFIGEPDKRGREGLCHDLSLRPMSGDRRIAVINDADLLNVESANALLKTLEEPPPGSLLILIASSLDDVLPTIRSRCQFLRFSPLTDLDVQELLLQMSLVEEPAEAAHIASLSRGSLDTARELLDDKLRNLRRTLYDGLVQSPFEALKLTEAVQTALDDLGGEAPQQRQNAQWLLEFLVEFYRQLVLQLSGGGASAIPQVGKFTQRLPQPGPDHLETLILISERAAESFEQIDRIAPVPLVLEALFDDLGRLHRRLYSL